MVKKKKSSFDKRAYNIFLTGDGESLVAELVESADNVNNQVLKGFDQKQRKELEQYLNKIILNLDDIGVNKDELDK